MGYYQSFYAATIKLDARFGVTVCTSWNLHLLLMDMGCWFRKKKITDVATFDDLMVD